MMRYQRLISLLLAIFLGYGMGVADIFYVDGFKYEELDTPSPEVRVYQANRCMSEFTIPQTVEYNGVEYRVTAVGDEGFRYMDCLDAVNLSDVEIIEDGYLVYYDDNGTTYYYGGFAYCDQMKKVDFSGLRYVGNYGFYGCKKLSSVWLDKVENLGRCAFLDCLSLKVVEMGERMLHVGADCFKNAGLINMVRVHTAVPPACDFTAFEDEVYRQAVLQVPAGSREAYEASAGWSKFQRIEEMAAAGVGHVGTDNVKVCFLGDCIVVTGAQNGERVRVFDVLGRLHDEQVVSGFSVSVHAIPGGVSLVQVGRRTFKQAF